MNRDAQARAEADVVIRLQAELALTERQLAGKLKLTPGRMARLRVRRQLLGDALERAAARRRELGVALPGDAAPA